MDYYDNFTFVLFRCDWFEVKEDKYGLIWSQYPFNTNKNYVVKTFPRDFFNMKEQSDSNVQQSNQSEPSDHVVNLAMDDENYEVELVRSDLPLTVFKKPPVRKKIGLQDDFDSDFELYLVGLIYCLLDRLYGML